MTPLLTGVFASQISGHLTPPFTLTGNYDALATVIVPSGGLSSITFAGIPQTGYAHLQLRAMASSNAAGNDTDDLSFQFNGDTGSSYNSHALTGNGSTAYGGYETTASNNRSLRVSANNGSSFGAGYIDILDYTNVSKYKVGKSLGGADWNGGGFIVMESLLWLNTSAINSMRIVPRYGTAWREFSSFALYGVKA